MGYGGTWEVSVVSEKDLNDGPIETLIRSA